jgi:hypothetical protein
MPAFRDALPNVRCAKQCLQIPGTVILHKAAGYKPATQVDISSLFNNNLQTAKWRRRESNPQLRLPHSVAAKNLADFLRRYSAQSDRNFQAVGTDMVMLAAVETAGVQPYCGCQSGKTRLADSLSPLAFPSRLRTYVPIRPGEKSLACPAGHQFLLNSTISEVAGSTPTGGY